MYGEATFGYWMRQRRRLLDLTQCDLARQVGCSEITIRKIEAGERTPSRQVAGLLATCLAVPDAEQPALIAFARGATRTGRQPLPPRHTPTAHPLASSLAALTRLLGRDADVARISARLLDDQLRLLTLVGPPGIGKTRLGLHVAEQLQPHFADGVGFVALAPLRDPALVLPALAQAIGIRQRGDQLPLATLAAGLRDRQMLLVLDNFEHLLEAAPQIADLLRMAPRITALVTSRSALNVSGEQLYAVPPLALPDPCDLAPFETLTCSPAIQLFAERVRAVQPDFTLTEENVPAVAEICARLDGLPLAIELAAARGRLFTPPALLGRLRGASGPGVLALLVDGPHDLPAHQRTLRSTIDWSYALLAPVERQVFARLGVFAGGFTAEAAEAICDDLRVEHAELGKASHDQTLANAQFSILNSLIALVRQSLLQAEPRRDGQTRFVLLETLREYALDQLGAAGALPEARRRHAAYYGTLAQAAAQQPGCAAESWLGCLVGDDNNIRAALEWHAGNDPAVGLRHAAALRPFWLARGLLREGRDWLMRLLEAGGSTIDSEARALGLATAGFLAFHQGDHQQARALSSESLALYRELGDTAGIVGALLNLGRIALQQAAFAQAESLLFESLALYRELGDAAGAADALRGLALVAKDRGDLARAAQLGKECLALYQQLGDRRSVARALYNLSTVAYWQGEFERAATLAGQAARCFEELGDQMGLAYAIEGMGMVAYKQGRYDGAQQALARSLDLLRALDEKIGVALTLHELGLVAHARGDMARAARCQRDGLDLAWRIGDQRRAAFCLEGLAAVLASGQPLEAAQLLGAAEALREQLGAPLPPSEHATYGRGVDAARAGAGPHAFAVAWAAGRALPTAQVVEKALAYPSVAVSETRDDTGASSNIRRPVSGVRINMGD
jgi:predicted ATPase/DNA-binding XRE family transcriptional regulator